MIAGLALFDNTAKRWRLTDEQRCTLMLQAPLQETAGRMGCISIGLGALFDENAEIELEWLSEPRRLLGGKTPLQCLLSSAEDMKKVALLVEKERGL